MAHRVTLIPGDGIGPEVCDAATKLIAASGVEIHWEIAIAQPITERRGGLG